MDSINQSTNIEQPFRRKHTNRDQEMMVIQEGHILIGTEGWHYPTIEWLKGTLQNTVIGLPEDICQTFHWLFH